MADFNKPGAFDAFKRELERRSLDTVMVFNPLEKEYKVIWDKRIFPVPGVNQDMGYGKGKMQLPRYVAEKFAKEMKDIIINSRNKEKSEKMIADHYAKGREELSKYDENLKIHDKGFRTDDESKVLEIYDMLILGVVQEYSAEYLDANGGEQADLRPVEERIAEKMQKKYEPSIDEAEELDEKKKKMLQDISA